RLSTMRRPTTKTSIGRIRGTTHATAADVGVTADFASFGATPPRTELKKNAAQSMRGVLL
ncbi:MAG: hypothetical protein ACI9KE_002259, partial [Polyangiales bacterium]